METFIDSGDRSLKVLVTGGSGFVGGAVVAELARRGHQVTATTRRFSERLPTAQNLRWIVWDALDKPLPDADWDNLEVILHLASPAKVFDFPERALPIFELAVAASFRLLESARRRGIRRVLVASTGDVLGSREQPASENDALYMPNSFYGAAKACSELLVRSYQSILSTAILRFYHPYGPGGERFLINRLVRSVAEGKEVRIEGRDGVTLNPVWIEDLALGVCQAIESSETGIFHFAGPETLTLRELLETIGSVVHREPFIRSEAGPCIQQHAGIYEATHRILGYSPIVSVRDGLGRLLRSPAHSGVEIR